MSVIANFQKRQLKKAQQQQTRVDEKLAQQTESKTAENTALALLAKLLDVSEDHAIAKGAELVEQRVKFVEVGIDLAEGEDQTVVAEVKTDEKGDITHINNVEVSTESSTEESQESVDAIQTAASDVDDSADKVADAASTIENTAEKVSEAASDLAYSADDINAATEELKEAADDLKKPSEAPKSSSGGKNSKQKNSSKK